MGTLRTPSLAGVSSALAPVMNAKTISTTAWIVRQTASSPAPNATKKQKKPLSPSSTQTGNPSQLHTQILDSTMGSLLVLELLLLETFRLVKTRLLIPFGLELQLIK